MGQMASILFLHLLICSSMQSEPISLYNYLTGEGILGGVEANGPEFKVNGKPLRLLSGSLHYFRVHPDYWQTRLKQYKAAGLNVVDVYVPWNLHEPRRGEFDFGEGSSQFSPFLNITRFLQLVKEEDLLAILRPGPYICAEWEFGGFPSWLLHEEDPPFLRSSHAGYQESARGLLREVASRVKDLQWFTKTGKRGGPLILTQLENEFGQNGFSDHPRDLEHLRFIKQQLREGGIETLLFTCDTPSLTLDWGNVDNELMAINFQWEAEQEIEALRAMRPNSPVLVSEFWSGWFDKWFEEKHNVLSDESFAEILAEIFARNASVNFYMLHGGTNFGFMAGAIHALDRATGQEVFPGSWPVVTSYDYNAPISESGAYTDKYWTAQNMIARYDPLHHLLAHPQPPLIQTPKALPAIALTEFLDFSSIVDQVEEDMIEVRRKPTHMEGLNVRGGNGQDYGFIVYRKEVLIKRGSRLTLRGHPRDLVTILLDGKQVSLPILNASHLNDFGSWAVRDGEFEFVEDLDCFPSCTLDIFVENMGRVNYGKPYIFPSQRKGLWEGDILLDDIIQENWEHIAMTMEGGWVGELEGWHQIGSSNTTLPSGPKMLRGFFSLSEEDDCQDSFFDLGCEACRDWTHGFVMINGFNIGRFHTAGPQKTLFLPGPILKVGLNEIVVFDTYVGAQVAHFTDTPSLGNPVESKPKH